MSKLLWNSFLRTILSFFLFSLIKNSLEQEWTPNWTWKCENTFDGPSCVRSKYESSTNLTKIPPAVCFLNCGPYGALWPYPSQNVSLGSELSRFHPSNVFLDYVDAPSDEVKVLLYEAFALAQENINKTYNAGRKEFGPYASLRTPKLNNLYKTHRANLTKMVVVNLLTMNSTGKKFKIGMDESYTLKITSNADDVLVNIYGNSYFGVRHGLETLTQLIAYNEYIGLLQIVSEVDIVDRPKFGYRGLMIDTGRNFIPIESLKRMIDGMSYNKLNIFHWHLTDSNSFPFESKRVPQVTSYGTYSPRKIYSEKDIIDLIDYANLRGIKIIPELDAPSHAGNGWQWGPLENLGELSLCVNKEPYRDYCIQPPCGQLNPLNENTYDVLGKLYEDFLDVFDSDYFHMGNDEISYKCWLNSSDINNWLIEHNTTDLMELWGIFQTKSLEKLKNANKGLNISAIIWSSEMTEAGRRFLGVDDYVIQIWHEANDSSIGGILNDSYRVIFSNKDWVYLDHGYGPWRDNGFPPKDYVAMKYWQNFYAYDILKISESFIGKEKTEILLNSGKIMGGEAALWSEKTDEYNMEMKLWPRSAAFAERMWSYPPEKLPRFAYPRLINHRLKMIERGIRADTLLPESCHFIMGFCD